MLGTLPKTLNISGKNYKIRTDYRDIFQIISAFNDPELTDQEKAYVCMKKLYVNLDTIPDKDFRAAYEAALSFIACNEKEGGKPSPKVINWEKDEQLMFPAINKVAGFEVRSVPYLHWWTFLGYFQGIDRDDTWGFILSIRQKRARRKKLEKHELEFYNANPYMCEVDGLRTRERAQDDLMKIYEELMKEGAE